MGSPRAPLGPGIVLLLALMAGGWFLQRGVAQEQNVYLQSRLFQEVLDHISHRFVDEMDQDQLYDFAIEGLLRELGDPNSALLNVRDYENFRIQTEGDYGGVGLEIVERDDLVTVVGPIPGTPGARAGIRAGDQIVEVDGESIRGWTSQEAVQVLRGRPGSDVEVGILRPGVENPIPFTLTRERIQLRSVPFAMLLDGNVGYIPLNVFQENSGPEVQAAADSLRSEGAQSFVLDLRGNPGGVLSQGIGITDLFLPRRVPVAETRGQSRDQNEVINSSTDDRYEGMPLVVLVDRGSASASEIVAGALQDHDRALVLGATTFGKGSVQTLFSLSGGNVLKLTTARWYTPAGRSIERRRASGEDAMDETPEGAVPLDPEAAPVPQTVSLGLFGEYVFSPDTARRPQVESVGGRPLFGGGGIVPDLLVNPDTLSADEQLAVRALFQEAGTYTTGVFNYAVAFLQTNGAEELDFEITGREVEELYQLLQDRGFQLDRETWERAERFTRLQLEAQVALQGWGDAGEFSKRMRHDVPLQRSLELLRGAEDPLALFSRAGVALTPSVPEIRPGDPEVQGDES
jgi:carboxyl-terminal processing protease